MDHAGARGGDAAGKLVGILLLGDVVGFCGERVVVRPVGGDGRDGGEGSCVGF